MAVVLIIIAILLFITQVSDLDFKPFEHTL